MIYLVRGLTLHGATNGLAYMFTPKVWAGREGSRGHPHAFCHLPGWVEGGRPRVGATVVDPGKVGVSPPGRGGAWIPSSDRQSLCPANSGALSLPSTLLFVLTAPNRLLPQPHIWPSPQSHPQTLPPACVPSCLPGASRQSAHPPARTSMHPAPDRGACILRRALRDPVPGTPPPSHPIADANQGRPPLPLGQDRLFI